VPYILAERLENKAPISSEEKVQFDCHNHRDAATKLLWTGTRAKDARVTTLQLWPPKSKAIVKQNINLLKVNNKRKQENAFIQSLPSLIVPSVTINLTRLALAESSQSLLTKQDECCQHLLRSTSISYCNHWYRSRQDLLWYKCSSS